MKSSSIRTKIQAFLASENGPTSVEYAVLLALILSVCIVSVRALGNSTTGLWGNSITELTNAGFMN